MIILYMCCICAALCSIIIILGPQCEILIKTKFKYIKKLVYFIYEFCGAVLIIILRLILFYPNGEKKLLKNKIRLSDGIVLSKMPFTNSYVAEIDIVDTVLDDIRKCDYITDKKCITQKFYNSLISNINRECIGIKFLLETNVTLRNYIKKKLNDGDIICDIKEFNCIQPKEKLTLINDNTIKNNFSVKFLNMLLKSEPTYYLEINWSGKFKSKDRLVSADE